MMMMMMKKNTSTHNIICEWRRNCSGWKKMRIADHDCYCQMQPMIIANKMQNAFVRRINCVIVTISTYTEQKTKRKKRNEDVQCTFCAAHWEKARGGDLMHTTKKNFTTIITTTRMATHLCAASLTQTIRLNDTDIHTKSKSRNYTVRYNEERKEQNETTEKKNQWSKMSPGI